jgi:cobalt-zinc-cadmium resistance protein CzcA
MRNLVSYLLRYRALVVLALLGWFGAGFYLFSRLDIEAYPDPSPPLVEVIAQNPSWSAEEMERQITVPTETALFGIPGLQTVRSISIFGLSDVKLYFGYNTDYFWDRQEVLNRLQGLTLPENVQPQLSPWSPTGEIYRYYLSADGYSLNELKATQDWLVRREVKQVPGIIDVTTFGGTTRQYQAEVDPTKLLEFNVTLPQVLAAVGASNANAGGSYVSLGGQSVNVRGLGLLRSVDDMKNVVITERRGVPVMLQNVATVHEGFQQRRGRFGVNHDDDAVEGIVLLQRGEQSLPALQALRSRIEGLNNGLLPHGMQVQTLYDRTDLINMTTTTVRHLVLLGLILVMAILLIFLGDVPVSLIATLTIPSALLLAFAAMVFTGRSANLISIGAIDFGILVDASVIVLESIHHGLQTRKAGQTIEEAIVDGASSAARPVLFSVLVIIAALIPLFTMQGVPGQIFAPMSLTYGYALIGALLFSLLFAPVLASWTARFVKIGARETLVVRSLHYVYERTLRWGLEHHKTVLAIALLILLGTGVAVPFLGGEFMPALEEGNLWVRATLPQSISIEQSTSIANSFRKTLLTFPEVTQVTSQMGRPDDGTDITTFNNIEFMVLLRPVAQWPHGLSKPDLVRDMQDKLGAFPGVDLNFSQNIQDNVEEAMSGVKGENSLKLFGDDLNALESNAQKIAAVLGSVPGVADLGVFEELGQPQLLVRVNRAASARFGLTASDVNTAVQAAIAGQAVTQILEGDRRFDFVVRFLPQFRSTPDAIRRILLPTPEGGNIQLGQLCDIEMQSGAFMVYREGGRRYIPIKFSVRGRDLAGTLGEVKARLTANVHLPEGLHYEWAGEYESLKQEQHRLLVVVPVCLAIIFALLFVAFNSWTDALLILVVIPFGAIGGVLSLLITGTPFSISSAVGFASVLGVCTLAGVVLLSGIRDAEKKEGRIEEAVEKGALEKMRPVLMACAAAGLGLLPAAVSSGIGVQAQQPLARVVVGGMITSPLAILFVLPVLVSFGAKRRAAASNPS